MRRKEVLIAVIGGVVGAVLVMVMGSLSPLGAQNELRDVEFAKITGRRLNVSNPNGLRLSDGAMPLTALIARVSKLLKDMDTPLRNRSLLQT